VKGGRFSLPVWNDLVMTMNGRVLVSQRRLYTDRFMMTKIGDGLCPLRFQTWNWSLGHMRWCPAAAAQNTFLH
jgi:hypothetical protein